jgi:predicted permease
MRGLWRDIGYAFRRLRGDALVSAVVIVQLSLAIGANTAIFSLVNSLLLRSLPVERPEELVLVMPYVNRSRAIVSYPVFRELRTRQDVFADVCAVQSFYRFDHARLSGSSRELVVNGSLVSASYFSTLGVKPAIGRSFTTQDAGAQAEGPRAVISDGFWQRVFGGDPDVLGRSITLDGKSYAIIGVTPEGFAGETIGYSTDIWLMIEEFKSPEELQNRDATFFQTIARLTPGVGVRSAETATQVLLQQLLASAEVGPTDASQRAASGFRVELEPGGGGLSYVRREFSLLLRILLAAVGLVLLTACLNVASLLVARNSKRAKEVALRLAVGATWHPIVRQYFTESIILGLMGGLGGLVVALASRRVLLSLVSGGSVPVSMALPLDLRVLLFTGAASILTGVVLGLFPASQARSVNPNIALKNEGHGQTGGRRRLWLRRSLVVSQVAISLVLVIGAALLLGSLGKLSQIDPGFHVKNVLIMEVRQTQPEVTAAGVARLQNGLDEALGRVPGVASVSSSWLPLITRNDMYAPLAVDGYVPRPGEAMQVRFNSVSPRYLETLGIKIHEGRGFTPADRADAPRVAVVNESMARKYFAGRSPIGQRLRIQMPPGQETAIQVVGVARDTTFNDLRAETKPMFHVSILQLPRDIRSVEIATTADPVSALPQVRDAMRGLEGQLELNGLRTLQQQLERPLLRERLISKLLTFFSLLCLLLTCVGIYGLLSYVVSQRTREIGLRMALGARRGQMVWLVLREALVLMLAGSVLGVPLAAFGTRVLATFLFGLRSSDPLMMLTGTAVVLACGVAAALIPGRRAAAVQPAIALRYE